MYEVRDMGDSGQEITISPPSVEIYLCTISRAFDPSFHVHRHSISVRMVTDLLHFGRILNCNRACDEDDVSLSDSFHFRWDLVLVSVYGFACPCCRWM